MVQAARSFYYYFLRSSTWSWIKVHIFVTEIEKKNVSAEKLFRIIIEIAS